MNAFIYAVSELKDTHISKEFKYFDEGGIRHLYVKTIDECPVCKVSWRECTESGALMFHRYGCGYMIAISRGVVKIGRKSAYVVRAVSAFHPGPIPEDEDTI